MFRWFSEIIYLLSETTQTSIFSNNCSVAQGTSTWCWYWHTFKAHSTRSAASSAAKCAGMSIADLLKLAGWTRTSTFERFYHKPIMGMGKNETLAFGKQGKSLTTQCHICSLATTWNWRFHKHPKDVKWNRNSISGKANMTFPPLFNNTNITLIISVFDPSDCTENKGNVE